MAHQNPKAPRAGGFPARSFPGHGMAQPHQRAVQSKASGKAVQLGSVKKIARYGQPARRDVRGSDGCGRCPAGVGASCVPRGFPARGNRYALGFPSARTSRRDGSRRPPCPIGRSITPSVWGGAPSTTARYSRINSDPCKRRCSRCCACAVRAASISPLVPLSSRFTGRYTKPPGQPA